MKYSLASLLLLLTSLLACSEAPSSPAPGGQAGSPVAFIGGTVELTGRLGEMKTGALQIVATAPGLATPLVSKCDLTTARRTSDGGLAVPFSLGSHSGMLANQAISIEAMPEELSLKVAYSTDGMVENIQHEHDLVTTVRVGDLGIQLQMVPGTAPTSRPASRPTSRPVAPVGD